MEAEVSKLMAKGNKATRDISNVLWDLRCEIEKCYSQLGVLMETGAPSKERKEDIGQVFEILNDKITMCREALRSISVNVNEFVVVNQEKEMDPSYLKLLASIMDTCARVIDVTKVNSDFVKQ